MSTWIIHSNTSSWVLGPVELLVEALGERRDHLALGVAGNRCHMAELDDTLAAVTGGLRQNRHDGERGGAAQEFAEFGHGRETGKP